MDRSIRNSALGIGLLVLALVLPAAVSAAARQPSKGQTIYLPVIPQTQTGPRQRTHPLALLMTIRNTDLSRSVVIRSVTYHDAEGKAVKAVLESAMTLGPLASHAIHFRKGDLAIPAGMSSCMIVEWEATEAVNPVLVGGVVIGSGTGWTAGLEFEGVVINER